MDGTTNQRRELKGFLWTFCVFLLAVAFLPIKLSAKEKPCVTVTMFGVDAAFEGTVLEQLRNELDAPIESGEPARACRRLIIELKGQVARILLAGPGVFETVLNLNEVPEAHRPRALALSCAGLWALSQPVSAGPSSPPTPDTAGASGGASAPPPSSSKPQDAGRVKVREKRGSSADTPDDVKNETDTASQRDTTASRRSYASTPAHLRFRISAAERLVPKYWAWATEIFSGIGILVGNLYFTIDAVGLFGGKSTDIGRIYTVGVGLRSALQLEILSRESFVLRLGPAADILAVFGYGRENRGASSYPAVAPVADVLFLIGGWVTLTPRVRFQVALGGGYIPLYFRMDADGKRASGMEGGVAELLIGFEFGR